MDKLKFVDVFSGIGGLRQGFEKNGHTCIAFSEIDKYAIKAYKTMYGDDEVELGDVSIIPEFRLESMGKEVDLVIGGSPCTAFSVAGKKGGFEDTRGSLFFEYCRTIKHTQPKYFLFENVKGVLSHDKGRTIDTMIRSFNEVGYTVDLNLLNSKYFDVPQNRERIFVVGVRSDLIDHEEWIDLGKGVLGKARQYLKDAGDIKTFNFDWPKQESVNVKLREILEKEVDEKYYINAEKTAKLIEELKVKDQQALLAVKGDLLTRNDPKAQYGFDSDVMFTLRCAVTHGVAERTALEESDNPVMVGLLNARGHESIRRVNGVSNTLTTTQGGSREPKIAEPYFEVRPTLTPERVNRRQEGRRFKENDEPAFTLTALDRHGVTTVRYSRKTGIGKELDVALCVSASDWRGMNRNQAQNAVLETEPVYRIRRLTPLECWRLQGFSDEDFFKVKNAGMSDSQLYKQAGNSVTINVIDALAKNINELHKTLSKRNIKVYN